MKEKSGKIKVKRNAMLVLGISITFVFQFSIFNSAAAQRQNFAIKGDVAVNAMVERHIEFNNRVKTIPGFRVQIASFSGANSKNSAFSLRDRFAIDYPAIQAYIIYDEPNFKVKVGDFRTRLEAFAFLQQIKDVYKGYIIKDNINPEPPSVEDYAPDDWENLLDE